MPGTFNKDLTDVNVADATTNWLFPGSAWATAVTTNSPSPDFLIQGNGCLIGRASATTGPVTVENWAHAPTGGIDLSPGGGGGKHIFAWLKCMSWPAMDTKANGGMRVGLSSDAAPTIAGSAPNDGYSNGKTWFVGGKDVNTVDGWICYVIDPNSTPNVSQGSPNMAAVARIGMGLRITALIGQGSFKPMNIAIDAIRVGTKLTMKDGTAGAPITFQDVFVYDSTGTNQYGICTKVGGVYYLAGKLAIGDGAQTAITYFKDASQTIVYQNFPVATTFYEIVLAGAASYLTTFQLGNYSGGLTSGGCVVKGATANDIWTLTAGAANVAAKLYAATISQLKSATFNSSGDIRSSIFVGCGEITAGGATFDSCTFSDLVTGAPISATYQVRVATSAATITNSKFVNCNQAVLWDVNHDPNGHLDGTTFIAGASGNGLELGTNCPSDITLTSVQFSGYGADGAANAAIRNKSGKAVTIHIGGTGSTPSYVNDGGGSSTTILTSQKTLTLTGLQTLSDIVILQAGTTTELVNIDQNAGTSYGYVYSYVPSTYIDVCVYKHGFVPYTVRNYLLGSGDASLPIAQVADRNYNDPA